MPLLGTGVLAIWNGVNDGMEREFLEWHVKEHIPERVGLPGFLRGRRYVAVEGTPAFFNFYETETPETLRSARYLKRLNEPSEWTRRVVSSFTDTSRTICRVSESVGSGAGSFVEVLTFMGAGARAGERALEYLNAILARRGVCGAHLLVRDEGPAILTSEHRLRKTPDGSWPAILIVEAVESDAILGIRGADLSDAALLEAGVGQPSARGLYRYEYGLGKDEVIRRNGARGK